ncbi:ABC transporter permease [Clostridium perfringens]|uniref:ABC transporter permease n=1 Tax=Clostridium perfringens TaxID=1502 RepID=UPI0013E37A50|nr:ABC transporter permease [Clostridium perfringens]NGT56962.1 ABC transporter permease subunit [Clostridium perfringens]NGT95629.1 ABC transporter permease subunit [Clostridium perfringens]
MLSVIKGEFKRVSKNLTLYLILAIIICFQIIVTIVQIGLFNNSKINGISDPYLLKLIWYTGSTMLFSILYSVAIDYQVVSKEYANKTWELLLLNIKNKNNIIFSKFILSSIFQVMCQIISFAIFVLVMKTYYGLTNSWIICLPFFLMSCLGSFFLVSCVFCIHLIIKNGILAIAFSIPLMLLPSFLFRVVEFGKYIPIMTVGYFLNIDINMTPLTSFALCMYNIGCGIILIYIVNRYFHL